MDGENISINNKALILSIVIVLFFMIGAVSASNETDVGLAQETVDQDAVSQEAVDQEAIAQETDTQDVISHDIVKNETLEEAVQSPTIEESPKIKTTIKNNDVNVFKGKEFSVTLTDENSTPIANKPVKFTFNKVVSTVKTDSNGVAKIKINSNPGEYMVKYSFSGDGYIGCEGSTKILVITSSKTKVVASAYTAYVGFKNTYSVRFTVGGNPLSHKWVTFKVNGKTYSVKTNLKGNAMLDLALPKGKYKITFSFAGQKNINPVSGSSKITVKKPMPVWIMKVNNQVYMHKQVKYFKVKLQDSRGNPVANKRVVFKVVGKKFVKRTNSKGIASLKIKLKAGNYKIKVWSLKNSKYGKALKTYKIKVNPIPSKNNGMWLFGKDMYSVNLKKLQKNGFKHILLNFKAIELYGKKGVEKWVKKANGYGMKVHLWMQVFYSGGEWQNPARGGIDYGMINSKVNEAKSYAKIKGIAGVHFDYVRYPGNAYDYDNSVDAINTFVKKASKAIHSINKNLIVSAAVMPEPSAMIHYYAQDIPTMSRYLDVIIPMVYKGNYNSGSGWIKDVTKTFAKQSKRAKIWTGLQSYYSDDNWDCLPTGELMGDARAAVSGGADGVILFRFGLFNDINFWEL